MRVLVAAGKGGTGKSTLAAAMAAYLSSLGRKVCVIDTDGGTRLARLFRLQHKLLPNTVVPIAGGMYLAGVRPIEYRSALELTAEPHRTIEIDEYLGQQAFAGDFGIIPWADMIQVFFGAPSDVSALSRLMTLVKILSDLEEYDEVVIDVEPTQGLERLLTYSRAMVRSLLNLQRKKRIILQLLSIGMPDIVAYLRGKYISEVDLYVPRIIGAVETLKAARYILACMLEEEPVDQLSEVHSIITGFGGHPCGIVANNMRGEPHEATELARVMELRHTLSGDTSPLPLAKVGRDQRLPDRMLLDRIPVLRDIGELVANGLGII